MPIDVDAFEQRCREKVGKRIFANMLKLQAAHKRNLSVANPRPHRNPAKRGQFPKARTFNLRDAVAIEPSSLATVIQTLSGAVGVLVSAEYGHYLKTAGWKGIQDTHDRLRAEGAYN